MPQNPRPDEADFLGRGSRPAARFQLVCEFADVKPKMNAKRAEVPNERLARFGLLDRSNQGDVPNLLRSDIPRSMGPTSATPHLTQPPTSRDVAPVDR